MAVEIMTDDRLHWHLDNWARYMRNNKSEINKHDYPSYSTGLMNGISVSEDSAELAHDEADYRDAVAMDAIIDSLSSHQQCAIQHMHLAAVWTMRDFERAYSEAIEQVRALATKRGMW